MDTDQLITRTIEAATAHGYTEDPLTGTHHIAGIGITFAVLHRGDDTVLIRRDYFQMQYTNEVSVLIFTGLEQVEFCDYDEGEQVDTLARIRLALMRND